LRPIFQKSRQSPTISTKNNMQDTIKKRFIQLPSMLFNLIIGLFLQCAVVACDNTTNGTTPTASANADTPKVAAAAQPTVDSSMIIPPKIAKTPIDSNSKVVYFTMDDGPLAASNTLIEIAQEKQVKISEFAVGMHAAANKKFRQYLEEMKRSPYMEVCNHSHSHANGRYQAFYSAPQNAANDMIQNEERLGLTLKIIRMPGRDIWATPQIKRGWSQTGGKTAEILLNNGFKVYGWDCEWSHYGNTLPKQSPEQFVGMVDNLFARNAMVTPNHLVILGHDEMLVKEKGRQDFRRIIDMLKSRGYIFEFMSNYPR
jgi:peptidoglycan-N-acetylglucosamine deacetylase